MALVGSGILGPGQAQFFDVALAAGITYSVYVEPDQPSVDFDLKVFDENSNLVAQDISTDSDALCFITPAWTGPFRLVVESARGLSTYRIRVED
ncbi:MAG TPA: hypothetical protein VFT91_07010 [Dehalococcoidia bacterium]|nr:hypothetical protein [Dehalococcoidia bacterium]